MTAIRTETTTQAGGLWERARYRPADGPDTAPDGPLWQAAMAFRLITLLYAISYHIASVPFYTYQTLSWMVVAVMAAWSVASAVLLSRGSIPRYQVVIADQVVAVVSMCMTRVVAPPEWYTEHQTMPTTLWVANAVLSAAVLGGPWLGISSATLMAGVSAVVRDQINWDLWRDATAPVLWSVGLAMGMATLTSRRAQAQLERALTLAAAADERERLAREVHDGVLQVLALVSRRGHEIGGAAKELAEMASEQETALRTLISGIREPVDAGGDIDIRQNLATRGSARVSVAMPAEPVMLARSRAKELTAVVDTALSNFERHAGDGAKAYVLLEDLGEILVVTVRDDGVGIPAGRLQQAEAEGRMGVSKSILGRVEVLGGTAHLETQPGQGTEWEIQVPKGTAGQ
ncbi:MAG: ATP-binding protein [Rhodococcus sp.]|nr:ATP-binding protein [Rhodococcus sp. (in: high G+C Gram-positive bacteria)]